MKGLATAFPAPGIRNKDSDTDEDDEEFEGFTQADIDDMQKKIDASPEDIWQWLTIDNECLVLEYASVAEIITT